MKRDGDALVWTYVAAHLGDWLAAPIPTLNGESKLPAVLGNTVGLTSAGVNQTIYCYTSFALLLLAQSKEYEQYNTLYYIAFIKLPQASKGHCIFMFVLLKVAPMLFSHHLSAQ